MEYAWFALAFVSLALYLTMIVTALWDKVRIVSVTGDDFGSPTRVSILRPLAGRDEDLAANLDALTRIEWPNYEVLLGVASIHDPAYLEAVAFIARHPSFPARVVLTDKSDALNPKVAQLISLAREATGEIVVISDANVSVASHYLRVLVAELRQPNVALASNLVVGSGEKTIGAALENLQLTASMAPSVLALHVLSGKAITVGKSMAMWRDALESVGGFASVQDLLAEDNQLGILMREHGYDVRVSPVPIHNRNVRCGIGRTFERHTRWLKMRRATTLVGFALEPLSWPIVVSSAVLLVTQTRAAVVLWGVSCIVQMAGAQISMWAFRGKGLAAWLVPLELVRAYMILCCWLAAWTTRKVSWRGNEFILGAGTALTRVSSVEQDGVIARPDRAH